MKLKLLPNWRLKFRSKMGEIKKLATFLRAVLCSQAFCILSTSSSPTRPVFMYFWSRRVDLSDHGPSWR